VILHLLEHGAGFFAVSGDVRHVGHVIHIAPRRFVQLLARMEPSFDLRPVLPDFRHDIHAVAVLRNHGVKRQLQDCIGFLGSLLFRDLCENSRPFSRLAVPLGKQVNRQLVIVASVCRFELYRLLESPHVIFSLPAFAVGDR
jgi:hypothetical protein